ncbi:hypothetical protein G3N59_25125 [Paraburkholderia sp. Ac-20340]|uniref:hypothetical protein n=1 Tax=Paraburkholderia sp. Ac-20340 TaxID=2703888 RepID=UPI00197F326B|nr:hypothetical protein [Paraburkholderia sp. Ac-20340]MBN3856670.1 hypothetical protein [Paraburkholderia sp. Ac-20340]
MSFHSDPAPGQTEIRARMAEAADMLPDSIRSSFQDQLRRIDGIGVDIELLEKRISARQQLQVSCRLKTEMTGVGALTEATPVAASGDAKAPWSGGEFSSFLGLIRRRSGTGR